MSMGVLPDLKRASDPPWTGVIDCCEPPCLCWELNLDPLGENHVLLTTDPSLQPPRCTLIPMCK